MEFPVVDLTEENIVRHRLVEADRVRYAVSYTQQVKQFHPLHVEVEFASSVGDDEDAETALDRVAATVDPLFVKKVREALEEVEDVISNG